MTEFPYWVNSGLATVGFRMPSHPTTLDLIRETGPLIGPSANISGQASGVTFNQILEDFDQEVLGLEDGSFSNWTGFNYFGFVWRQGENLTPRGD